MGRPYVANVTIEYTDPDMTNDKILIVCNNKEHEEKLNNLFYASILSGNPFTIKDVNGKKIIIRPNIIHKYYIEKGVD